MAKAEIEVKTTMSFNLQVSLHPGLLVMEHAGEEYTIRRFNVGLRYLSGQYMFWGFKGAPRRPSTSWSKSEWSGRAKDLGIRVADQPAFWGSLPNDVRRQIEDAHDWLDRKIPPLVIKPLVVKQHPQEVVVTPQMWDQLVDSGARVSPDTNVRGLDGEVIHAAR